MPDIASAIANYATAILIVCGTLAELRKPSSALLLSPALVNKLRKEETGQTN